MSKKYKLTEQLEYVLPGDCVSCGWGLPGPHDPKCELEPILKKIDRLEKQNTNMKNMLKRLVN